MNKMLVFFIFSVFSFSQKADLTSAILAFQKNDNVAAKEFVDIAYDKFMQKGMDQEKPKIISKFWYNRGRIYYALGEFNIAVESFINDLELNAKGGQQKKSLPLLLDCAVQYNNLAIAAYDSKEYNLSAQYFENTFNIRSNPNINVIDTAALFNASVVYSINKDFSNSLRISEKLISLNSQDESYQVEHIKNLEKIGTKEDLISAINFARSEIPSSVDIIFKEVNFYIEAEDYESLKISLDNAIKADPSNHILYFALGSTFENLDQIDMAKEYYIKALDISPDYFDANNNLAAIYVTESNPISKQISETDYSQKSKRSELIKKRTNLLKKALVHLNKCFELDPDSMVVLISLRDVYGGLGDEYESQLLDILAKIRELNQ